MNNFDLQKLIRPNVAKLKPYSSARDEFEGEAEIFLDANENPFPTGYNRYPDPACTALRNELADLKGIAANQVFIGNGSDEAIDLLMRAFAIPGQDKIAQLSPTYGMYKVSAEINDLSKIDILLTEDFDIALEQTLEVLKAEKPKLLFACSPNNPTGNCLNPASLTQVLENFEGLVIVDEAYADFSDNKSWVERIPDFPNLVVLQTFSKARGLAALRIGQAFASAEIISILNRIKPPYNVNLYSQEKALENLKSGELEPTVKVIQEERSELEKFLSGSSLVKRVYPSQANFLLVEFESASWVFQSLKKSGIVVRDRQALASDCLRITVGTKAENELLKNELLRIEQELQ